MNTRIAAALLIIGSASVSAQTPQGSSHWDILLGAGVIVAPTHAGSDEYRVLPIPIPMVTYRGRVFLGPTNGGIGGGIGARVVRTERLGIAAELGMVENRRSQSADVLAGTDDRDVLLSAGTSVSYRLGPLEATAGVQKGMNDRGGVSGNVGLGFTGMLGQRVIAGLSGTAIVADARQLRRTFGVTELEAERRAALIASGDVRLRDDEAAAYRPDGGLSQVGAGASLTYLLSQHWAVSAFGDASRLGPEARESPLVRRRAQFAGGMALVWRR